MFASRCRAGKIRPYSPQSMGYEAPVEMRTRGVPLRENLRRQFVGPCEQLRRRDRWRLSSKPLGFLSIWSEPDLKLVTLSSVWRSSAAFGGRSTILHWPSPFGPFGARLEGRGGAGRGPLSGEVQAPLLPCRCRLRKPGGLRVPGGRRLQVCDQAARQSDSSREDPVSAQAPCWSPAHRRPAVLRQLQLSGAKLEDTAPRGGQGRVAPGRALSARRLHRHQHDETGGARRCLLQSARHGGAVDQGRQERRQVDAALMLLVRRQRRPASAACAGLQSRQLHADAGSARGGQAVVADEPAGKTREDRRQGRVPWPLRHLPDGRGRGAEGIVPGNLAADRRTATKAGPSVATGGADASSRQKECAWMPAQIYGVRFEARELVISSRRTRDKCEAWITWRWR